MRVEKIQRKHRNVTVRCHNGCMANPGGKITEAGFKVASHRVWLIGYPTPLCDNCAKEWERVYDENLGPAREAVAA